MNSVIFMFLLSRFIIHGHSMEPTIFQGQTVLVSSIPFFFSKPKIDDIVLIRHSGKRRDVPDGTSRSASRISPSPSPSPLGRGDGVRVSSQNDEGDKFFIKRIAKIDGEKYFVSGDNKKDSMDSRRLGWIKEVDIMGKVVLRLKA